MDESTTITPIDNNMENEKFNDVIKKELMEELNIYEKYVI